MNIGKSYQCPVGGTQHLMDMTAGLWNVTLCANALQVKNTITVNIKRYLNLRSSPHGSIRLLSTEQQVVYRELAHHRIFIAHVIHNVRILHILSE